VRFLIAGTEGVAYLDWCQRPEDAFGKFISYQGASPEKFWGDLKSVQATLTVADFYQGLFDAIRDGQPCPVSGEEGRRAVRAWELLCASACQGRSLSIEL